MTIFDIKPISYWRCKYKNALYNWEHLAGVPPRTVIEVDLLRQVNQRLRWERDLAADAFDRHQRNYEQAWLRAMERINELEYRLAQNPPISHETPVASTNTPANGSNAEIGGILQATKDGGAHEPAR